MILFLKVVLQEGKEQKNPYLVDNNNTSFMLFDISKTNHIKLPGINTNKLFLLKLEGCGCDLGSLTTFSEPRAKERYSILD
jgi:hypothetical protein